MTHGEGPLLILAGAGSGKTRVLTHRIAYLLRTGAGAGGRDPRDHVHQQGRARRCASASSCWSAARTRAMWVMTFHSACARMLRADAHRLGYTRQFTIYDGGGLAAADQAVPRRPRRRRQALHAARDAVARSRTRRTSCARRDEYRQLVGSYFEQTVADVYEHYERELHRMNAMDFDDLLFRAVNVLELFQEVRDRYANAFR